jgi:hypothetical protein
MESILRIKKGMKMLHQFSATSEKGTAKPVNGGKSTHAGEWQGVAKGEDIHEMIATAAYYRAERRGFTDGGEMEDWLEAEEEIIADLYPGLARISTGGLS